jgi:hypothetical protein
MAGLIGIGRKKKAFADEASAKSTALKHKMAKSRAELAAQDYANEQQTKGTVVGAVGPIAGMAAYDYAKEEGLLGAETAVGEAPVNGLDYSNMTTDKSAIEGAMHQGDGGALTSTSGTSTKAGLSYQAGQNSGAEVATTLNAPGAPSVGATVAPVPPPGVGTDLVAQQAALQSGGTQTATNVVSGQAAVGPAGAAPAASGLATAGVGLVGAAGAFGGKALASEVSDDPVVPGVGSVGGGVAAGAAAGAMVGGVGAPIGAAIGGIAGLLGAF